MYDGHVSSIETEFQKFVASQQENESGVASNWAGVKEEWLKEIDSLYRRIGGFLKEYVDAGFITFDFREVELTEDLPLALTRPGG